MGRPQDSRLQRSGNTPIDPDHIDTEVQTQPPAPREEPGGGPVPPENQPGHHPAAEQDKPDLDQFAERLGIEPDDRGDEAPAGGGDEARAGGADSSGAVATLRSAATTARDLAEPVTHLVQEGVTRAARMIEDRRTLVERVERLEQQVAELIEQLSDQRKTS
jgi:hypothetical protein